MVDRTNKRLSIRRQCTLLDVSRSSVYASTAQAESPENLHLMRLIDEQYLKTPFYGTRQMTRHLRRQGFKINRKRVQRLMRKMALMAIYQAPRTSKPHPEHQVYRYLLRGLEIERVNQVWSTDITYIPMNKGFLYLVTIIDWHSRAVLAWRLSNTMDVAFCVSALDEALEKFGPPEIFNSDQGSQFTSNEFIQVLENAGIKISMDGIGRWRDNVFVERLWRSLKYECVYLSDFENGIQAEQEIKQWIRFYNEERPHSSLSDDKTPMEEYMIKQAA